MWGWTFWDIFTDTDAKDGVDGTLALNALTASIVTPSILMALTAADAGRLRDKKAISASLTRGGVILLSNDDVASIQIVTAYSYIYAGEDL